MTDNKALFAGIETFVAVVDAGSFTAAARRLGHSPSYVSKEIARLEEKLNTRLLYRTTRSISLTDAGRSYYTQCVQLVSGAQDAERSIVDSGAELRGSLKVSAPVGFGLGSLSALLPEFLDAHPKLTLDLAFTDQMVDVIADGYDVVFRVGPLTDSNLIARQVSSTRGLTVASPTYLQRNGRPMHPSELANHVCISYAQMQMPNRWDYRTDNGESVTVDVQSRVLCNSAELERVLAVAGVGVTRLPEFSCADELRRNLLEPVLTDYERPPMGIFAIYPHRRHLSQKVRAFVDFLVECLGQGERSNLAD